MNRKDLSEEDMEALFAAVELHGSEHAAKLFNMVPRTVRKWVADCKVEKKAAEFVYDTIPAEKLPVSELVAQRKKQFTQKKKYEEAANIMSVNIGLDGPIGILHFGDPHVDDDGTDIAALEAHTTLVNKTEGLFGANVGDTSNNWVGRLARLYGQQSTSAAEAWQLVEWFIGRVDWLYLIGGNHDGWSGAGDPINWIQRMYNAAPYTPSSIRLSLCFPNKTSIRINARHDFVGHSQWNSAHGPLKAAMLGVRDHITIAGHRHISGYNNYKSPDDGILCHAIRVASYKVYDAFAKEKGFMDQTFSPCVLTTIDPYLPANHPDLVKVFWDPFEGADYLSFKRRKFKRS